MICFSSLDNNLPDSCVTLCLQALEVTPQRCSSHWHHSEIRAFEFSKFFIKIIFYNFLPDEFKFRYIKEKNP